MIEIACEPGANCNIDQQTFKEYLARRMAASVKVAPWTHDTIMPLIRASALAAASSLSLRILGLLNSWKFQWLVHCSLISDEHTASAD